VCVQNGLPTTSEVAFSCYTQAAGAAQDEAFAVICIGP
jgi:hypothetical protein